MLDLQTHFDSSGTFFPLNPDVLASVRFFSELTTEFLPVLFTGPPRYLLEGRGNGQEALGR